MIICLKSLAVTWFIWTTVVFQTFGQSDSEHAASSQQTQCGVHGKERTAPRRLHPPVRQGPSQGKDIQIILSRCSLWQISSAVTRFWQYRCFHVCFQVKDLLWNSDSSVLAVWLEDMSVGEDKQVNACSKFCAKQDKKVLIVLSHLILTLILEAPFHEALHFDYCE